MIISLFDEKGKTFLLNTNEIVSVEEAGASGAWHGIRSYIKLSNKRVIECGQTVMTIATLIESGKQHE